MLASQSFVRAKSARFRKSPAPRSESQDLEDAPDIPQQSSDLEDKETIMKRLTQESIRRRRYHLDQTEIKLLLERPCQPDAHNRKIVTNRQHAFGSQVQQDLQGQIAQNVRVLTPRNVPNHL